MWNDVQCLFLGHSPLSRARLTGAASGFALASIKPPPISRNDHVSHPYTRSSNAATSPQIARGDHGAGNAVPGKASGRSPRLWPPRQEMFFSGFQKSQKSRCQKGVLTRIRSSGYQVSCIAESVLGRAGTDEQSTPAALKVAHRTRARRRRLRQ